MKNIFSIIILIPFLFFISCGNSNDQKEISKKDKWNTKAEAVNVSSLPSISFDEMKTIHENADFIDIIFYNVDFSMSVNNKANIQRMVGFVSTNVAKLNTNCQPMGRIFFQQNGALLAEADMYYENDCRYFVFHKNKRPAFANDITPEGQAYFAKIFSQVKVEPAN